MLVVILPQLLASSSCETVAPNMASMCLKKRVKPRYHGQAMASLRKVLVNVGVNISHRFRSCKVAVAVIITLS